jgi:Na+/proline symporter
MIHGYLLVFIGLYLFGTVLIGWWASSKVKTTKDFVIAGRRLPTSLAACALFATWFGSETILGAPAEFAENGVLGIIEDPFGAGLCLVLVGLIYARPLYRLNILTFNDFFKMRFGRMAEITSAVFMIPSYFGWIAAQLVALAIVLKTIIGVPLIYGINLMYGRGRVLYLFWGYVGCFYYRCRPIHYDYHWFTASGLFFVKSGGWHSGGFRCSTRRLFSFLT